MYLSSSIIIYRKYNQVLSALYHKQVMDVHHDKQEATTSSTITTSCMPTEQETEVNLVFKIEVLRPIRL